MDVSPYQGNQSTYRSFYGIALPSGYLCLADLDSEGGLFHGDNRRVFYSGFDRVGMRDLLMKAGFDNIRDRTAATVLKPVQDAGMVEFTVFLMIGRKKST